VVTLARQASGRRLLGLGLAVAVLIPLLSAALDLYDRAWHWGKVVHASEALILTLLVGLLWLGYRDRFGLDMPSRLVVAAAIATGVALGVAWELGAFTLDWVFKWDLQASNADTMTDFLWLDLAAIAGGLIAARLYGERFDARQRRDVCEVAAWLTGGPARLLDEHPRLVGAVAALAILAYLALLWFVDRAVPGLPTD
jgi:hypothetical protein